MRFALYSSHRWTLYDVALRWILLGVCVAATAAFASPSNAAAESKVIDPLDSVYRPGFSISDLSSLATEQTDALQELLPIEADLPPRLEGLEVEAEGKRSLGQIAAGFPNPAEATDLLIDWGFYGNAYRNFVASASDASRSGTIYLEASLHGFATSRDAAEALSYYASSRATVLGHAEIPVRDVGDQTLAIGGPVEFGADATVYARTGSLLIRVSAAAAEDQGSSDPRRVALVVVQNAESRRVTSTSSFSG